MTGSPEERPVVFECDCAQLVGILHEPRDVQATGVVIVVGGPQYRVGSHRQFVLLARSLAARGFPVLRFDYRGIGDSAGPFSGFEDIDADTRAAVDTLCREVPGIAKVVLWGLCDAASAAMMYAPSDRRIRGLVLLNPWARSESGQARTLLRHYYLRRFASRDFWRSLLTGRYAPRASLLSLARNVRNAFAGPRGGAAPRLPFLERMLEGFQQFDGIARLIISGDDLTAAEFTSLVDESPAWQRVLQEPACDRKFLEAATHTFSSAEWRRSVEDWTAELVERV